MSTTQPGGLPPTDLAGAFGRASGLVGALPTSPRGKAKPAQTNDGTAGAQATSKPAVTAVTTSTEVPSLVVDDDPTHPDTAEDPQADDEGQDSGGPRAVVFYVPLTVRNRLTAYRRTSRTTTAEVLLDAFDSTYDQLPSLLGTSASSSVRPSRFERPTSRRTSAEDDPLVQVYVNLSPHNLGVIDDITKDVAPGATRARSKVAAAALNAFLPPTSDAS